MNHRHRGVGTGPLLAEHDGNGLADDIGTANDHDFGPGHFDARAHQHFLNARRRTGQETYGIAADNHTAQIDGVESVDVLVRIDGVNDLVFVDMLGERKLDKDTVDGRIPVVLVDQREKRLFADVRGLVVLNLMKAERQRRLHLQGHITDGSRIFSDQNGHKPRNRAVLFPNGLNFLTQFVKNRRPHLRAADDVRHRISLGQSVRQAHCAACSFFFIR